MTNNLVPEVRFPGFTDAWEQRKFEEMLDKNDGVRRGPFGSSLKKEIFVENSDYVVYEQQNAIYDNYKTRYNISKEKFDELHKFSLKENDFIMSGAGTIGRISRVPKGIKPGVFNQALIRFRINSELTSPEYFLQFIRAENMQRKLTGANPGSAITNLVPMTEVKNWDIFVPAKAEQSKLGAFFNQLDNTIALHQRELDNLKATKQGFLGKMFPKEGEKVPEIRFPGFIDDWNQRELSEVSKMFDNLRIPVTASDRIVGDIPYYGANGIQDYVEGYTHDGEFVLIAEDGANDLVNYPVNYINGRAWINNHAHVVRGNDSELSNLFLVSRIRSMNILPWLVGGGRAKLNGDVLKKLPITIPSYDEQRPIGIFFKQLEDTINLQQQELEKLQQTKQAFLQKMFI